MTPRFNSPSHFSRDRLPDAEAFYVAELGKLRGPGNWRSARCPFHEDAHPSLRVHVESGAFRCFGCGARGGDVLDFQMQRYGQGFVEAARALGAWGRI